MAHLINGMINTMVLPLSKRQKMKTKARVAQELNNSGITTLQTSRGPLTLYGARGSGTASSVERYGLDEPETLEWIDNWIKPGETLWDIGAHIGCYSLYAGLRKDIKVFAFEPSALNFALLVEHIAANHQDEHVKPFCIALSDKTKIEDLHMSVFETGQACNAIGKSENQFRSFKPAFSQGIPAFTAEDFCTVFHLPPPDHIKLDVDGIEEAILNGAKNILPSAKTLMIEVEGRNAENASRIEKIIADAGLEEDVSIRDRGHCRNRLYINRKKT